MALQRYATFVDYQNISLILLHKSRFFLILIFTPTCWQVKRKAWAVTRPRQSATAKGIHLADVQKKQL